MSSDDPNQLPLPSPDHDFKSTPTHGKEVHSRSITAEPKQETQAEPQPPPKMENQPTPAPVIDMTDIHVMQEDDEECRVFLDYLRFGTLPNDNTVARRIILESQDYILSETGILYHLHSPRGHGTDIERQTRQLVVPFVLRNEVMQHFHDSVLSAHFAFDKTYSHMRQKYFWKNMYADLYRYCKSCPRCQKAKRSYHNYKQPLHPLPINANSLFHRHHIDVLGPLSESDRKKKYVLVVCDSLSKWTTLIPLKNQKAETIAWKYYKHVLSIFGAPSTLISDRGKNFLSAIVTNLSKLFQIGRLRTSKYHPQTNSTAETVNKTLMQSVRALTVDNPRDWDLLLPGIAAAINMFDQSGTQFSPYFILFKKEARIPLDVNLRPDDLSQTSHTCWETLLKNAELIMQKAGENVRKAQEKHARQYNKNIRPINYTIGQKVLVKNIPKPGLSPKLQDKYVGPFFVTKVLDNDVYILRECSTNKPHSGPVNALMLKPFFAPDDMRTTNIPIDIPQRRPDITNDNAKLQTPTQDKSIETPDSEENVDENQHITVNDPKHSINDDKAEPQVQSDTDDDSETSDHDTYIVEKILASRNINGQKHYKIKWQSFKTPTWEPARNIPEPLLIDFHAHKTNAGRKKRKRKSKT